MKISPVEAELFHADRETRRIERQIYYCLSILKHNGMSCTKKICEEANSRLSQCCELAYKLDTKIPKFFRHGGVPVHPVHTVRTLVLKGIAVVDG